jgi:hypothetical protein
MRKIKRRKKRMEKRDLVMHMIQPNQIKVLMSTWK